MGGAPPRLIVTLILTLSVLFAILVFSGRSHPPQPSCKAAVWLTGVTRAPENLERFLFQFPGFIPPHDMCVCFAVLGGMADYAQFAHVERLILVRGNAAKEMTARNAVYRVAIASGAEVLFDADENVFLYGKRYGTGKGDVSEGWARVAEVVPYLVGGLDVRSLGGRIVMPGFDDAIANGDDKNGRRELRGFAPRAVGTILGAHGMQRGMLIESVMDERLDDFSDIHFDELNVTAIRDGAGIVGHCLAHVNEDDELVLPVGGINMSRDNVLLPGDATAHEKFVLKKAVHVPMGVFVPVNARTTFYSRAAAWGLFKFESFLPLYGDVLSAYVAQRVMWESETSLLIIEHSMDYVAPPVWPHLGTAVAQNELLSEAVRLLSDPGLCKISSSTIEDCHIALAELLHANKLVPASDVSALVFFYRSLHAAGVRVPPLRQGRQNWQRHTTGDKTTTGSHSAMKGPIAETAVCITGQMRSAPFTSRNIEHNILNVLGSPDTFVVTEKDDRTASATLFRPVLVRYSSLPSGIRDWIYRLTTSPVRHMLHETMSSEIHLYNYIRQLYDQRICMGMIQKHERKHLTKYKWIVRMRPDVLFERQIPSLSHFSTEAISYPSAQSYYAINDRFFLGPRDLMERVLTCHDVFWFGLNTGKVFNRTAGPDVHALFKKQFNSERFLARCAAMKRVALQKVDRIDPLRVAYSHGKAQFREFGVDPGKLKLLQRQHSLSRYQW